MKVFALYFLTAVAEIVGCYLPYLRLKQGKSIWLLVPAAIALGVLGHSRVLLALAANVLVAFLLYRYRTGDSNMQSVWICSRNDAIGNVTVMLAAVGVGITGSVWPDLLVAFGMSALALSGALQITRQAQLELRQEVAV